MPMAEKTDFISEEEYLKGELTSDIKYEYVDGKIYAMAGASPNHGRISSNINRILGNHLMDSSCEPFSSDMKVKTSAKNYRYPDVLVVCDDKFTKDEHFTEAPTIIVEVLSKSTRKIDERDKLLEYINIPTLKEYVIVEQYCADITIYRQSDDWYPKHYFLGENIYFESIDLTLPVEDIYYRVKNDDMIEFLESIKTEK